MSAKLVRKAVYRCVCELPDCPGQGKPWYSKEAKIPPRCNHCHRYTWNNVDRRRQEFRDSKPKRRKTQAS